MQGEMTERSKVAIIWLMEELNVKEWKQLKHLTSPRKIQDFLDAIPMNFEKNGDTCLSPRTALKENKAHCMEGAMLAAVALRLIGRKPLVIDMKAVEDDFDHVIAVFLEHDHWGAISKTNHGVLRYREPVYKNVRELVMSFFHEYFLDDGRKTLRSYTNPVDLSLLDKKGWMTDTEDVWYVPDYLESRKHFPILTLLQIRTLRRADPIEREMGKIIEWPNAEQA